MYVRSRGHDFRSTTFEFGINIYIFKTAETSSFLIIIYNY